VIFGVGDYAQVASVYLDEDSPHEVVAFTVHERYLESPKVLGRDVIGWERLAERYPPDAADMLVAIGFSGVNRVRTAIYEQCKAAGYRLISYVSSRAAHFGKLELGDNCFVFEDNVIQPFVRIGNNVVIWSGNHIGHHSVIEDDCFIASHAVISGHVTIGRGSFVGVNATFRDGVTVAPECVIGAGAVILHDTVPKGVYKGPVSSPAPYRSDELRNF
jgi:sugar O-acyltransferase (sialic acid O-acetyltransferase NeuD family)